MPTKEEAQAELSRRRAARGSSAQPAGGSPASTQAAARPIDQKGLFQALKHTRADPEATAERNAVLGEESRLAKLEQDMPLPRTEAEMDDYMTGGTRSMLRGMDPSQLLGYKPDLADTVGSGVATLLALPNAMRAARGRKENAGKSDIDLLLQEGTPIYSDIKGTVDWEEDDFKKRQPAIDNTMTDTGKVLGTLGAASLGKIGLSKALGALKGGVLDTADDLIKLWRK